jgi:hypothetical protein
LSRPALRPGSHTTAIGEPASPSGQVIPHAFGNPPVLPPPSGTSQTHGNRRPSPDRKGGHERPRRLPHPDPRPPARGRTSADQRRLGAAAGGVVNPGPGDCVRGGEERHRIPGGGPGLPLAGVAVLQLHRLPLRAGGRRRQRGPGLHPRTRVGLPAIRLHDVRHSYASAALAAGIPAKIVSERLGHANVQITLDTYSHVIPGLAAATVARLILEGSETASVGFARQRCCQFRCQNGDAPNLGRR